MFKRNYRRELLFSVLPPAKEYVTFKILSDLQKTKIKICKQTHFYYIKIYIYVY